MNILYYIYCKWFGHRRRLKTILQTWGLEEKIRNIYICRVCYRRVDF